MTTALTRSFVSVSYLLGTRGSELSERMPEVVARLEAGLVRGLQSEDRSERTRFLAASIRELTAEVRSRSFEPKQTSGDP